MSKIALDYHPDASVDELVARDIAGPGKESIDQLATRAESLFEQGGSS